MSFWDGSRWVADAPRASRPSAPSPLATWGATAAMIIGLAAIILPLQGSTAGTGWLSVTPEPAQAGELVTVNGGGFSPRLRVTVTMDGAAVSERSLRTGRDGALQMRFRIPPSTAPGSHELVLVGSAGDVLATATLTISAPVAAEAETVPSPTATATPAPTASVTPTASPTAAPTAASTPIATPVPTTAATPKPAATSTPAPDPTAPPTSNAIQVPSQYGSIQAALNAAPSGATIEVAPGVYYEELHSVRSGVTVRGYGAVLRGSGVGRPSSTGGSYLLIEVNHDNVTFAGFELTNAWRGARIDAAHGSSFLDLYIHHIGRTGIEVSHGATRAAIRGSRIHTTGLANEGNAEAIYIGTARSASSWNGPDLTRDGVIAGNVLGPNIAEGIDIKDDVSGFTVVGNDVSGATEPNSGAINVRGHHNRLESNRVHDNLGSGLRFGGTSESPARDNVLLSNISSRNGGYGYKFIDGPQTASGNSGASNAKGLTSFSGASFPI